MPYQHFLDAMSSPRIGVYRRVFRTQSPEETFGVVMWAQAIASALQTLVFTSEVALRNRIHMSLSRQASTAVNGQESLSFPWYDHTAGWKTLHGETYSKVEALLCTNGMRSAQQPSPDRVVAELSLGVWPNILDGQLTQREQQRTFNDVFPDHPNRHKKHWNYENARKDAVALCKDLQHLRNRIAHCGPIWPEGWFKGSQTQMWTDMLARLKARRASLLLLLSWICEKTAHAHATSFAGRWFDQLCSENAVIAYMEQPLGAGSDLRLPHVDAAKLAAYLQRA
jgi:hypothetical protein